MFIPVCDKQLHDIFRSSRIKLALYSLFIKATRLFSIRSGSEGEEVVKVDRSESWKSRFFLIVGVRVGVEKSCSRESRVGVEKICSTLTFAGTEDFLCREEITTLYLLLPFEDALSFS